MDLADHFWDEDQHAMPFEEDWSEVYGKPSTSTSTALPDPSLDKSWEANGLLNPNSDSPASSTLDHSLFSPVPDLDYDTPNGSRMKDFEASFGGFPEPGDAGGSFSINLEHATVLMDAKTPHYSPEASQTFTEPSDIARPEPTNPILAGLSKEPKVPMQASVPAPCKYPGCDKTFSSPSNLRRHERSTHGARKPCPQCGKLFKVRADYHPKHMEVCNRRIQKQGCPSGTLTKKKQRGTEERNGCVSEETGGFSGNFRVALTLLCRCLQTCLSFYLRRP